jgi:hypothetical protein
VKTKIEVKLKFEAMADDKEVQEQTIADEVVLKKYKEAGEIVNS